MFAGIKSRSCDGRLKRESPNATEGSKWRGLANLELVVKLARKQAFFSENDARKKNRNCPANQKLVVCRRHKPFMLQVAAKRNAE